MLKRIVVITCFLLSINNTQANPSEIALYLLAGAPTFDLTVAQLRDKYSRDNPTLPIGEFRVMVPKGEDSPLLTRAASKINDNLYASTALEKGTGKIKTLQLTHLPLQGKKEKIAKGISIDYMAALMRQFEPALTIEQSVAKVNGILEQGKASRFYQQQIGAIRYVVVDHGGKGVTFAIEPIKLISSEP